MERFKPVRAGTTCRLALCGTHRGVIEVIAAGALQEVAARAAICAIAAKHARMAGTATGTRFDQRVPGQVACDQGADAPATVGGGSMSCNGGR